MVHVQAAHMINIYQLGSTAAEGCKEGGAVPPMSGAVAGAVAGSSPSACAAATTAASVVADRPTACSDVCCLATWAVSQLPAIGGSYRTLGPASGTYI